MPKEIKLSIAQVLLAIQNWMECCDGDELARVTGELFGGSCYTEDGVTYDFIPDENYFGQFGDVQ